MTSSTFRAVACSLLLVPIVACGDDDGGGDGGMGAEAAATSSVEAGLAFGELADTPESEASLGAALSVYASGQALHAQAQAANATGGMPGMLTQGLNKAYDPSCASTTGNTTTYTACEVAPTTFDGTVSVSGDDVTVDITAEVDPAAYNGPMDAVSGPGASIRMNGVTVTEQGTLTVTPTTLDGVLNVDIDLSMTITMPVVGEQTTNQTTSLDIDYDSLVIDNGCATGGTLTVSDSSYTAVATYGPACGDVAVAYP